MKFFLKNFCLGAGVFLLDYFSKRWAIKADWPIYLNQEFAFSLPSPVWVINSLLIVVFVVVAGLWYQQARLQKRTTWLLSVVLGAGASNLFDRFTLGGVIDWLVVQVPGFPSSHFNIADLCIILSIIIYGFWHYQKPAAPVVQSQ